MVITPAAQLRAARRSAKVSQDELAQRAGVARMTVQKIEAGSIDPRLSTLVVLFRALGLEMMLVPAHLTEAATRFITSGGRLLAQPPGLGAPASIIDTLGGESARAPRAKGASVKRVRKSAR